MKIHLSIVSAAFLLLSICPIHAGNFIVDKTQSELAADMHASPSHDFTTVARDYTYDIEINPDTLVVTKASCRFKFADLDSDKNARDKKMRKWMDVEAYPEASFTMKKLTPTGELGSYLAEGDFAMHGKHLPLKIDLQIQRRGEAITLTGTSQLDHRDWGLEKVRLFFFTVDPVLKPRFQLVGKLQPGVK